MNKFDNILKDYLKEENTATKVFTSPQFQDVIGRTLKQAGPLGDSVKALGATLLGDPHVQDFNRLLDPKNTDFKTVDDFLKKYPDLTTRFTELGLYTVPKKPEVSTNNDDNNNTNTNQNVKKPNETQSTSTLQGVDSMQGV